STRTNIVSCTAVDDAPNDGCRAAAQLITIDFATLMPVEGAYTAGELKPGESVAITFNAIVQ
ncbi:MAG: hypothetical protein RQ936_03545, partial [Gammaproteobacteria bacterium]|nr:hypothetical protein [Gammaproteobacteria bacterium]